MTKGEKAAPASSGRSLRFALAGFAGVLLLALLLQPWWLAPLVAHRLSASSGRAVHFDSMWVSVSPSLEPVVELRGVRIDNAPWADSRRPFAALASATAVFSWRSIEERRPVIALMVLRDGEVDLERRSDGLRNWRLRHPENRGPGRFKVLAIRGERATLRFLHGLQELDIEARATPNRDADADTAANERMPTRLDARGTWRGIAFVVGATTSEALTLLETGRSFRLRGHVEARGARLDIDGRAGDIVRWPLVDAQIVAAAASLARLAPRSDPAGAGDKGLRLEATLRGDRAGYALSALQARLGATDLAGDLRWVRGEQRDLLRAELTSDAADLADLRALAGRRPTAAARSAAAASAPAARASTPAASAAAVARRAHPLDVELHFAARRLRAAELPPLQSAKFEASLVDGRLQVPRFEFGLGQGRVAGKASVEVAARPMRGEAEIDFNAIRLQSLLGKNTAERRLSGALHGHAALKASGESFDALVASAVGTVDAVVSGGTISSLLDAQIGLQGGRILRSMLAGAEPIAIHCAAAIVDVRNGEGRIRTLVVDTERTRTVGTGTIDLARRTLDVILTPEVKQSGLLVLDRSIRLHGALREPRRELVARVEPPAGAARGCRGERP